MRFNPQLAATPLNPKIYSQRIPDGDAGVDQTIRWMKALVHGPGGVRSWQVRQAALDAARGTERGIDEIDAVFQYVKDNIEFRGEYGETLQEPRITLQARAGDCDDQSMLMAAMLGSLGYETRFQTVALLDSPDELSHVYVEVRDKRSGQWIPVDTTVKRAYPGWQPDNVARSVNYGAMNFAHGGLAPSNSNSSLIGWALAGLALLF